MSRLISTGLLTYTVFLLSASCSAAKGDGPFAKLDFLKGQWQSNVKLADGNVNVSDLSFNTVLKGQFLQINYNIAKGTESKSHRVIVGAGLEGSLKAWTFTSEGKTYESTVKVEASKKECVVKAGTGDRAIVVKFVHTGDNTFDVEYQNKAAQKDAAVRATFTKAGKKK